MKKLLMLIAILCCVFGCNKKEENVGNLKEIAKLHIYKNKSIDQSQGCDRVITDTLVCNDSVIIVSSMYVLGDGSIIPCEDIFTRQRTSKEFVYRVKGSMFFDGITRSIAEGIKVNNIPCNKPLLKKFLSDGDTKIIANKLLYTKALSESMNGTVLKEIKE